MRYSKYMAAFTAAMLSGSTLLSSAAMAASPYSVDMSADKADAWSSVAMANDDTVTSGINIRETPGEDSAVVGYLYRGGAVTVLEQDDTWTHVSSGEVDGYIKNEYLIYGNEAKGLAEYYGTYGVKASWNDVNVFSGSDAASAIIGTANDGDAFIQVSSDGHWIEVQKGADSTAFVSIEDVTPVIMMNSAVSVSDASTNAAAEKFTGVQTPVSSVIHTVSESNEDSAESAETLYAESTDTSYAESTDTYSEETASYTENADTAYEDTYTEESYSDSSTAENTYEDTSYSEVSEAESTYTETADTTPQSSADYSYTAPSTDGMDLQTKASTLYQAYLEAQSAADAAVANGAGEQAITDTAAAATQAYVVYVEAQNAADAASWGVTDTASSDTADTAAANSDTGSSEDATGYAEEANNTVSEDTYTEETPQEDTSSASTVSSSDLELLAALIYCEAGNQPYEGQVAVGAVVMNRVASGSFPNTISDVIYAGGQFTPAYSGALASALANGSGSGYISAASEAMAGSDPTGGALYFNTSHGSGTKIGAHWFY